VNAFTLALLVGFFGGLANLLVDIPALWNYDWNNGIPSYADLVASLHRYHHDPVFCLFISFVVWVCFITFAYGLVMG